MILSLNCAKGKSSTYAVLSFVSRNPHYIALLLQEPWLNSNWEPPSLARFDMFIPTPTDTKCATYTRKSAHLKPSLALNEANCFLGANLSTSTSSSSPSPSFTLYNPYSPNR